ncbi:MAG: hypothetical protein ACPIOQ_23830 [Promethearchaeia archaeon]
MSAARCRDQRREADTTVIEGDSTITDTASAAANIYTKRDGAGRRRLCEEVCPALCVRAGALWQTLPAIHRWRGIEKKRQSEKADS